METCESARGGGSPRSLGSLYQGIRKGIYRANGEGGGNTERREETIVYNTSTCLGHPVVKDARKASGTYSARLAMRDGDLLHRGCRSRSRGGGIYLSICRVYHHHNHRNIYERDFFASSERGKVHARVEINLPPAASPRRGAHDNLLAKGAIVCARAHCVPRIWRHAYNRQKVDDPRNRVSTVIRPRGFSSIAMYG